MPTSPSAARVSKSLHQGSRWWLALVVVPAIAFAAPPAKKAKPAPKPPAASPAEPVAPAPIAETPKEPPPPAATYRTVLAQPDRAPAPAATPAVEKPVASAPAPQPRRFSVAAGVGVGVTAETFSPNSGQTLFRVEVGYRVVPRLSIGLDGETRFSKQTYTTGQPTLDLSDMVRLNLDEQRLEAGAAARYDVAAALAPDSKLILTAGVGFRMLYLVNEAMPSSLLGPGLELTLGYRVLDSAALEARAAEDFNLTPVATPSAIGPVRGRTRWGLGVSLQGAGGRVGVEAGYRGESLAFDFDSRLAHSVVVQVSSAF